MTHVGSLPRFGDPARLAAVREVVEAHVAFDVREERSRRRILRELAALADPFDEHGGPVHVTGSAVVVGDRGTILHLHRRLRRWMQTGGHVEGDEDPPQAARRESEEETGLELTHPEGGPVLVHVDVHPAAKGHTHLDLRYLLLGPDEDPSPPARESPHVRWFSWEEAHQLADDSLRPALEVAHRHLRSTWDQAGR